jgi:hypothetical protein
MTHARTNVGRLSLPWLLPLTTFAVCGCASNDFVRYSPTEQDPKAVAWHCYDHFARDVSEIAGTDAIDCGFMSMQATDKDRTDAQACAQAAVAGDKPFKFGWFAYGDDSSYCKVAIRTPTKQLVSLYFDSDVTGSSPPGENNSHVWTARCQQIEILPTPKFSGNILHFGRFFDLTQCTDAPEIFNGLSSRKKVD